MAISVQRFIELVVDWTEAEIKAAEDFLGIHPTRIAAKAAAEALNPQPSVVAATVTPDEAPAVLATPVAPTPDSAYQPLSGLIYTPINWAVPPDATVTPSEVEPVNNQ